MIKKGININLHSINIQVNLSSDLDKSTNKNTDNLGNILKQRENKIAQLTNDINNNNELILLYRLKTEEHPKSIKRKINRVSRPKSQINFDSINDKKDNYLKYMENKNNFNKKQNSQVKSVQILKNKTNDFLKQNISNKLKKSKDFNSNSFNEINSNNFSKSLEKKKIIKNINKKSDIKFNNTFGNNLKVIYKRNYKSNDKSPDFIKYNKLASERSKSYDVNKIYSQLNERNNYCKVSSFKSDCNSLENNPNEFKKICDGLYKRTKKLIELYKDLALNNKNIMQTKMRSNTMHNTNA